MVKLLEEETKVPPAESVSALPQRYSINQDTKAKVFVVDAREQHGSKMLSGKEGMAA